MVEVSKREFWETLMSETRDVTCRVIGEYPYTCVFRYRDTMGDFGKIVSSIESGHYPPIDTFYLAKNEG